MKPIRHTARTLAVKFGVPVDTIQHWATAGIPVYVTTPISGGIVGRVVLKSVAADCFLDEDVAEFVAAVGSLVDRARCRFGSLRGSSGE